MPAGTLGKNDMGLRIKNNLGYQIKIKRIDILNEEFNGMNEEYTSDLILNTGDISTSNDEISIIENLNNGATPLTSGSKYDIKFKITIENTGSGLTHEYIGEVKGKVA
jgi:hypothetical protein